LEFHLALDCPVWIIGYCEMRKNGIFKTYTEKLKELYADKKEMYKKIFLYRHFSMNQFTIDLKQKKQPEENVKKSLKRIGDAYRELILGK
jgi:N-formylglutamate amidohydrolase